MSKGTVVMHKEAMDVLAAHRSFSGMSPVAHPLSGRPLVPDALEVLTLGRQVLSNGHLHQVERFEVLEQVFLAALETGDEPAATDLLSLISSQFPVSTSGRSALLQGRLHEFRGEWEAASELYDSLVLKDDTNVAAKKRKMALLVSHGDPREAIEALIEHLGVFMQDTESWLHLARLYTTEKFYSQAAFCYEEVMLIIPHNVHHLLRYADLQVIIGDLPLAIKYYCHVLEICQDHLRALYGLYSASKTLIETLKSADGTKKLTSKLDSHLLPTLDTLEELHDLGQERISVVYGDEHFFRDRGLEKIVTKWLDGEKKTLG